MVAFACFRQLEYAAFQESAKKDIILISVSSFPNTIILHRIITYRKALV